MAGEYPYTVQICGHIEYTYCYQDERCNGKTFFTDGGCELPAEFVPALRDLLARIEAKYPKRNAGAAEKAPIPLKEEGRFRSRGGHIEYTYCYRDERRKGEYISINGGCEIPAEFVPALRSLSLCIDEKYPNL